MKRVISFFIIVLLLFSMPTFVFGASYKIPEEIEALLEGHWVMS